jgi:hypothetical protein
MMNLPLIGLPLLALPMIQVRNLLRMDNIHIIEENNDLYIGSEGPF